MSPAGGARRPRGAAVGRWSVDRAERYLLGLELFGMRFGLARMRRLMSALDAPNERFASIHVVGSNGKSSTTRMIAALLERHGLVAGAYTSPHLVSFTERIQVAGRDVSGDRFAAAVARVARAAAVVDRTRAEGDDRVTQFEAVTAAAYSELAAAGVDVAVVEAGLGGRFDATNVLDSTVAVLTNVGLEHTRWLGPTISDIAREKVDVLRPGGVLVLGGGLHPDAHAVARRVAADRDARIVVAPDLPDAQVLRARGAYQRRNLAVAVPRPPPSSAGRSTPRPSPTSPPRSWLPGASTSSIRRTRSRPCSTEPITRTGPAPWPSRCPTSWRAARWRSWSRSSTTRTPPRCSPSSSRSPPA